MYNNYISGLLSLQKDLSARIAEEIDECMHGRGDSARLKESLEYKLDNARVLQGVYKDDETCKNS